MDVEKIKLESSWKELLLDQFSQPYMLQLKAFIQNELTAGKTIYPKGNEFFAAFNLTPFDKVKVIILGQDPYHGPNQAHGLCFSVRPGITPPPSLINIYKELKQDISFEIPKHGYLEPWCHQGVLLLNTVLTVRHGSPGSHRGQGWETFTDRIIHLLNEKKNGLVFLLWGAFAHKKSTMIDHKRHLTLKAAHPSPLSAYNGFMGCRHFSQTNSYLQKNNQQAIDWSLPLSFNS